MEAQQGQIRRPAACWIPQSLGKVTALCWGGREGQGLVQETGGALYCSATVSSSVVRTGVWGGVSALRSAPAPHCLPHEALAWLCTPRPGCTPPGCWGRRLLSGCHLPAASQPGPLGFLQPVPPAGVPRVVSSPACCPRKGHEKSSSPRVKSFPALPSVMSCCLLVYSTHRPTLVARL